MQGYIPTPGLKEGPFASSGLGCMTTSQTHPPSRLHLLVDNWRPWHLQLKPPQSQKVGCTAEAVTQSGTSVSAAGLSCTKTECGCLPRLHLLGANWRPCHLNLKPGVTSPKRWVARQKLSPSQGRQSIWAELREDGMRLPAKVAPVGAPIAWRPCDLKPGVTSPKRCVARQKVSASPSLGRQSLPLG